MSEYMKAAIGLACIPLAVAGLLWFGGYADNGGGVITEYHPPAEMYQRPVGMNGRTARAVAEADVMMDVYFKEDGS